jgi:glycosyltransferase involved in cell wall biosynthesis
VTHPLLDVAVVIPVWNRRDVLTDTLETVANQTRHPRTVLVVDDGSTDDTAVVAEAWFEKEPRPFRHGVLRVPHAGLGATRNRGWHACEPHAYIQFLDSDDLLPEDFYERTVAALEADPTAVAASTDHVFVRPDGEECAPFKLSRLPEDPARWFMLNGAGVCSLTILRTDALERAGEFREDLPHSADLFTLFDLSAFGPWLHVPGAPVRYQQLADESNLSRVTPERSQTWARYREEILRTPEAKARVGWLLRTHVLARSWLQASKIARAAGCRKDAIRCALRSIRYRPLRFRGYKQLVRGFFTPQPASD